MKGWQFIYGKFISEDNELYINSKVSIEDVNEVIEETPIEGRNGCLIERKGYYNERKIDLPVTLINRYNYPVEEVYNNIKASLLNEKDSRLIFMDRCYLVDYIEFGTKEIEDELSIKFNIVFHCKPFAVDYSEKKARSEIINIVGDVISKPILEFYCNGEGIIDINSNKFYVSTDRNIKIKMNCEDMEIINVDNSSETIKHSGYWCELNPGKNEISHSNNITNFVIRYRNNYL